MSRLFGSGRQPLCLLLPPNLHRFLDVWCLFSHFGDLRGISRLRNTFSPLLYVAPVGQDLYISRAITVLPSFDMVRIVLLILLVADLFIGPALIQGMLATSGGSIASLGLGLIFIALIGILFPVSLIVLPVFLYISIRSWLVEKDFWQYLRRSSLNDFELDDIMVLEHITDETVHTAAEQLKLDATKISPPPNGYQQDKSKRRVRLI